MKLYIDDGVEIAGYFISWAKETYPNILIGLGNKNETNFNTSEVRSLLNSLDDNQRKQYQEFINNAYKIHGNNEIDVPTKEIINLTEKSLEVLEEIPGLKITITPNSSFPKKFSNSGTNIEQSQVAENLDVLTKLRNKFFGNNSTNNTNLPK